MKTQQKGLALSKSKGFTLSQPKGFTLLELLIVIAILAVLATVAVLVINPVEYLRQARDSQRINDLAAVKGAIDLYTSATTTVSYGACTAAGRCSADLTVVTGSPCTGTASTAVTGAGWVDINFASLTGGSPLPKLPVDPSNTTATFGYAYLCSNTAGSEGYELDTKLESSKFVGMMGTDGGTGTQAANFYEVGSKLSF